MVEEKICNKCVLPSSTPGIKFDKSGVCNYCNSYVPIFVRGEEELRKIFEEEKRNPKINVMTVWLA